MRWVAELVLLIALMAFALAFWPGQVWSSYGGDLVAAKTTSANSTASSPAATAVSHRPIPTVVFTSDEQSLQKLLVRSGLKVDEAVQADRMVSAAIFPDTLEAGTEVMLQFGSREKRGQRRQLMSMRLRPRLDLALTIFQATGGGVRLERTPIAIQTTTERLRGRVTGALGDAIVKAGGTATTAAEYIKALTSQIDVPRQVHAGDAFELVTTVRHAADGKTEQGEVLYAALSRKGQQPLEVLRWGQGGRFQSAKTMRGEAPGASMWPVNGRFTSGYGLRFHPILGYSRMHAGIDISSPAGTPIYAVSDGIIAFAGWHGGHGNYIRMDQADGEGSGYAHLSRIAVTPGEHVASGQVIGYVGSTGLSTGPHLHYEVYRDGRSVDPLTTRFARTGSRIDHGEFQAAVAALKALSPIAAARMSKDSSDVRSR